MIKTTAIGAALAASLLLAASPLAVARQPHPAGASHAAHAAHASYQASHAARTSRAAKVRALRHATNGFHDLSRAQHAGYGFFTDAKGIACIDMPGMGGMGVHFVDGAFVGDPAEHLRKPEALVYRIDKAGVLRLAAVEYVVLAAAWNADHSAPPKLFGQTFALTTAPNRYGLPDYYSLHAWVWHHNAAGMFAPYNPGVTC